MDNTVIKIKNLKKQYKLGTIGAGTLQGEIQSWWAKVRGKEDPNLKIGQHTKIKNQKFMALDGINLEIYRGEAVGIIGSNGAGKSTMLKILSRVTAPTEGEIIINGRISSMLEVGTGFNEELTGRENIYLNGAILGMTKKEVDEKLDKIIEFSECQQFIDTPVKRYSSGMYVKLAFAVAAHLDSEILVMDEVLAVGDMKFQEKCLGKMGEVTKKEDRTVLYVSHNMNTIRKLCNRVVVLEHGKIIFNGDVEEGIQIYLDTEQFKPKKYNYVADRVRPYYVRDKNYLKIKSIEILNETINDTLDFKLVWSNYKDIEGLKIRAEIKKIDHTPIATALLCENLKCIKNCDKNFIGSINISKLNPGKYEIIIVMYQINSYGTVNDLDLVYPLCIFEKECEDYSKLGWCDDWGHIMLPDIKGE